MDHQPTPPKGHVEGSGGFTPGPWTSEDSEIYAGDYLLAETVPLAGDEPSGDPSGWYGARELANARLIASAPALYEALTAARYQIVALALDTMDPEAALAQVADIDLALSAATGTVFGGGE